MNRHLSLRSGNPALRADTFQRYGSLSASETMTINGTVNKTALSLLLVMLSASWTWQMQPGESTGLMILGGIGGFIAALVTMFNKKIAQYTVPIYAILQGLFLGGISKFFEMQYPGIVNQAVFLTFGTLGALLLAYKSGVIKATENFKLGVFAATGGIAFLYLISFIMSFFGSGIGFIHNNSTFGILFSFGVVIIAALNLVLDFDFIEEGAEKGAPKYMEWYATFGLLVTLIWLYLEILRLLAKLKSRR